MATERVKENILNLFYMHALCGQDFIISQLKIIIFSIQFHKKQQKVQRSIWFPSKFLHPCSETWKLETKG